MLNVRIVVWCAWLGQVCLNAAGGGGGGGGAREPTTLCEGRGILRAPQSDHGSEAGKSNAKNSLQI